MSFSLLLIDQSNIWREWVNGENAYVFMNFGALNIALRQHNKDHNDIYELELEYYEKYNILVEQAKDIADRLVNLKAGYDVCRKLQISLKRIYEVCGLVLEGDSVLGIEADYPIPKPTFKPYSSSVHCTL